MVTEFDAIYYDGKTSARIPVHARASGSVLLIAGANMNLEIALDRISADARIGDVRRTLSLPGGAQLQTDDHAALAVLFPQANRLEVWVHKLEQHRLYVVGAFVTIAVFSWWSMVYGVPLAAKTVTRWMPRQVETVLGDQSLASIDKTVCSPSGLPAGRQQQLRSGFSALTSGLDDRYSYRLEFRDCRRIGPNAFALPGGTIVITDSLIELATDDRQITAVLAHEIGHVRNRHGLRLVLQGAGAAALISTLAGDAVSITALAAALPTLLLETGYSREFETEADTYAFKRLKEIGLSPKYFADMLTRLQTAHSEKQKAADKSGNGRSENNRVFDYLSTHPDTAERIQRALDAQ